MEERFIDAVVIKSGEKVRVRQTEAGSEYFVTEDNSPYHSKELDFTQQDIVDKLTQDLQDQMGDPFKESRKFYEKIMTSLDPLESEKRRTELPPVNTGASCVGTSTWSLSRPMPAMIEMLPLKVPKIQS